MIREFVPGFDTLQLTSQTILGELGYGNIQPEQAVIDRVETLLKEVSTITHPLATYRIVEGKLTDSSVKLGGTEEVITGSTIASLLKKSSRFALFVCTAGKEFQKFQENIKNKDDLLDTFIVDTIGSCIAEKTGDYLEQMLEEEITPEIHTNRFSPGYCGWNLATQEILFRWIGEKPCGVELSSVFLMQPIKSISGIIGIGTDVNQKAYGCQYCELETCYKRNKQRS